MDKPYDENIIYSNENYENYENYTKIENKYDSIFAEFVICGLCGFSILYHLYHICEIKLNKLKLRNKLKESLFPNNLEEDCAICLESFIEGHPIIRLECNHIFHKKCITSWFDTNDENNCPLCRIII